MSELKSGQEVYVSDTSVEEALKNESIKYYIDKCESGLHYCKDKKGYIREWQYVTPIPEKKIEPWNQSNIPLDCVVRCKETGGVYRITEIQESMVGVDVARIYYDTLLDKFEWIKDINDRTKLYPCGIES